ncbi:MAG: tRNA guanosine(34) transglycosylase Tgt [Litorilinea sp.]
MTSPVPPHLPPRQPAGALHHPASLTLPHGDLRLPAFLPDATLGAVRAVDSQDLLDAGVPALVMNTFHLMQHPGSSTVAALGGLHAMTAWPRPIITDSGGFQAYSLIRQNPRYGTLTDRGILFRPENQRSKLQLTPEKAVQLQLAYGADVVMCLDDCTHVDDAPAEQRLSVRRTLDWAKRCRQEYDRQLDQRSKDFEHNARPLLFGVVQGGGDPDLRRECAETLLEIGFDGYGYGGWPLDGDGNLLVDMLAYTRSLIPAHYTMHALGVGHPDNVIACAALGYGIFDSALPTRDARQGRLYSLAHPLDPQLSPPLPAGGWMRRLYINDAKHIKLNRPISEHCACHTCRRYSVGYLHHLFKQSDVLFMRLATIHNLHFMAQLTEVLAHDWQTRAAPAPQGQDSAQDSAQDPPHAG